MPTKKAGSRPPKTPKGPSAKRRSSPKPSKSQTHDFLTIGNLKVPSQVFSLFGTTPEEYDLLARFDAHDESEKVKLSRELIQQSIIDTTAQPDGRFALAIATSQSLLAGYATLDQPHRTEIQRLILQIKGYLQDKTRKRPLNALMLASPGAGKSHFIRKLAAAMKAERVEAVTFNMATMQTASDMAQPIDELRNLKVNDEYPLLFLDEFDSDASRFAALLPLLWDGELHIGHRDLKLGKAVIVLAGSSPQLPKTMAQSAAMRHDTAIDSEVGGSGKLVDLLSRINGGVIDIPDLDLRTGDRDRRVDKVCVTVALLRGRFGDGLTRIPRALLRFIAHTTFRYSVRSLAHLIEVIDVKAFERDGLNLRDLGLPLESEDALQGSSLRLHLIDKDQGFGIVNRWKEFSADSTVVSLKRNDPLKFWR